MVNSRGAHDGAPLHGKSVMDDRGIPTYLKRRFVAELTERDGFHCHYCGITLEQSTPPDFNPRGVSLDHIIPRIEGGADDLDNLVLCCRQCNAYKKTAHYHEFCFASWTDGVLLFLMGEEMP